MHIIRQNIEKYKDCSFAVASLVQLSIKNVEINELAKLFKFSFLPIETKM